MKRAKQTTFACILLSLCLALGACSSGQQGTPSAGTDSSNPTPTDSAPAPDAGEKSSIRYFTWTEEQVDGINATIEAFNKENPNITVDLQIAPWDQYWTKMQTEIAGGTCADVFMNQTFYFKTLQTSKAAEPLTPLMERDSFSVEGHNQKVVDLYSEDGVLYAMPQDWDCECIVYNKDLFDKYGVPYPDDTLEWNPTDGGSFLKLAQQMTVDSNGKNALDPAFDASKTSSYGFIVQNSNNACYWNFMAMNGGDVDKYDDPKTVESLQFLQDLMYKYNVAPQIASVQSMGADSMFATGNIAMYTVGNWILSTLEKTCDFDWQVAVLPKGPENRSTLVNGIGQSVYSGGKNKEAAWQFVKWLGDEKSQEILGSTGTVFPSRNAYWDDYIGFWSEKGVDISPFQEMFDTSVTYIAPLVPHWNEKSASITKNFDLVFMNKMSAEEAGKAIAADYAALGD